MNILLIIGGIVKRHTIFKMFWKTYFRNRMNKPFLWSLGSEVAMVLTTRCPFKCAYCQMFIATGEAPRFTECTVSEWKKFIEDYTTQLEWIEMIMITGGETTLYDEMPEFVNWLVERGHHVLVFTNLWKPEVLLRLKKHYRLLVWAALHKTDSVERFDKAYQMVKDHFRIGAIEFVGEGEEKKLPYTTIKPMWGRQHLIDLPTLSFPPDAPRTGRMYAGCYALYRDGTTARDKPTENEFVKDALTRAAFGRATRGHK